MNCSICHEPIVENGRPGLDYIHTHGDVYCGCGDGSVATP